MNVTLMSEIRQAFSRRVGTGLLIGAAGIAGSTAASAVELVVPNEQMEDLIVETPVVIEGDSSNGLVFEGTNAKIKTSNGKDLEVRLAPGTAPEAGIVASDSMLEFDQTLNVNLNGVETDFTDIKTGLVSTDSLLTFNQDLNINVDDYCIMSVGYGVYDSLNNGVRVMGDTNISVRGGIVGLGLNMTDDIENLFDLIEEWNDINSNHLNPMRAQTWREAENSEFNYNFKNLNVKVISDNTTVGIANESQAVRVKGDLGINVQTVLHPDLQLDYEQIRTAIGLVNEDFFVVEGNANIHTSGILVKPTAILNLGEMVFLGNNHFTGDVFNDDELSFGNSRQRTHTLIDGDYKGGDGVLSLLNTTLQTTGFFIGDTVSVKDSTLIVGGEFGLIDKLDYDGQSKLLIDDPETLLALRIPILSEGNSLTIGGTGKVNDAVGGDFSQLLRNFPDFYGLDEMAEGREVGVYFGLEEGEVVGRVVLQDDATTIEYRNKGNEAKVNRLAGVASTVTRVELNDLRKRLGDVRAAEGTTGAWARYNGGSFSGDRGYDADFNMIQVGGDTLVGNTGLRLGGAFSYARTEADDNLGKADSDTFSFAGYGVWQADNGFFVDSIVRFANLQTDMTDASGSADIDSWLFSLSGEVGMRYDFGQKFFVEPAAELTYTYIDGDSFTIGDVHRTLDDADSLTARLGATVGMTLPQDRGDIYVRAGVVNEFLGDFDMTSRLGDVSRKVSTSIDGTWVEFALGANVNLNKNTYLYADLERTEGADIDEDWRANLGVRVSF